MGTSREGSLEEAKKSLDWELSLEGSDLRSHGWFHGNIPRQRAEQLVAADEDFLVRDCTSRPGDFVLSTRWRNGMLHFVINKVILQPYTVYERVQYTFEEDHFDTVPDLVTYYVGNKRPISKASGAIISNPVNRTMPLSFYASKYSSKSFSSNGFTSSLTRNRKESGSNTPTGSGRYQPSQQLDARPPSRQSVDSLPEEPPPKPSRCSSSYNLIHFPKQEAIYMNQEMVKGGNNVDIDGDESRESEDSAFFSGSSPKENDLAFNDTLPFSDDSEQRHTREPLFFSLPPAVAVSCVDPQSFLTFLLPKDNKPLDAGAVVKMQSVLIDSGARILANHLTRVDLEFIRHLNADKQVSSFGTGVVSGLEWLTLPQGHQFRRDLLDRTDCFKFFVAVTVLTCRSVTERAAIIAKWIQIALETKAGLGNLQGFAAIVLGLTLPQVTRLRSTWLTLRQHHTKDAFTFEAKLRPTLNAMTEYTNAQAPNTTFPYVLTLVQILQQFGQLMDSINGLNEEDTVNKLKRTQLDFSLQVATNDYGLQLMFFHLDDGRKLVKQSGLFRRNGEIVLDGVAFEDLLLDMFHTEFHRRFLWGFKGSVVGYEERFSKFEQVLSLLSAKCEPS